MGGQLPTPMRAHSTAASSRESFFCWVLRLRMLLLATVTLAVAAAAGDDTVAAGGLYVNEDKYGIELSR